MKTVSLIDESTGLFTGVTLQLPEEAIAQNTPPGCAAIEGQHDHLSKRYDLDAGKVVDYVPPQPDDDHEWDDDVKRWRLTDAAQVQIAADEEARATIQLKEAASLRTMREALLVLLPEGETKSRLQTVENDIQAVRADVLK